MAPKKIDKGKAVDRSTGSNNERTPLLGEASSSRLSATYTTTDTTLTRHDSSTPRNRRTWSDLLIIAIIICSVLLAACLFILLLAYSFVPSSDAERNELTESAVEWRGPTRVDVVNITDSGIWVDVGGEVGVDLDQMMGIRRIEEDKFNAAEKGWRGAGAVWWENLRTSVGDWGIEMIGDLEVEIPEAIELYSAEDVDIGKEEVSPILIASIPAPLEFDLTTFHIPRPLSSSSLQHVSSLVHIHPIADSSRLVKLAQQGWKSGYVDVVIRVKKVQVGASGMKGGEGEKREIGYGWFRWRKMVKMEKKDLTIPMRFDLSRIPGLPSRTTNLSDLIKLESYSLQTRNVSATNTTTTLGISAVATVQNIVPHMRFDLPWRIGFEISLPVPVEEGDVTRRPKSTKGESGQDPQIEVMKMAEVLTSPIYLRGQDPIAIRIDGEIVGDLNAGRSENQNDTALSAFLRNYLDGKDNTVIVKGSPEVTTSMLAKADSRPPQWLLSALPHITASLPFPAPNNEGKLIRSVTIEGMKISQGDGKMRASGTVLAEIELPKDLVGVKLNITGVNPDVLVFDGPAPEDGEDEVPEEPPYPLRAFGRINPGYLDAESQISEIEPNVLIVRAPLVNVPLNILEGRDNVLSDFVGKVIFKGGALAGVKGTADVEVQIQGVNGAVEVAGLGVSGDFTVGRPRLSTVIRN